MNSRYSTPTASPSEVKELTPAEAYALLDEALFVDVREAHELLSGKIPGAAHVPLGQLLRNEEVLETLPHDKKLVVYCQHGVRSLTGAGFLQAKGFADVAHLKGGIVQWQGKLA